MLIFLLTSLSKCCIIITVKGMKQIPHQTTNRREKKTMCKPNSNIISKVEELMELRKMIEGLQEEAEAITDQIKDFMGDEETMLCGSWKITYRETVSKRIDSAALKKDLGNALDDYYKVFPNEAPKEVDVDEADQNNQTDQNNETGA